MATGSSRIEGYLRAQDTDSTLAAIRALGAGVEVDGDCVQVDGVGLDGARPVGGVIDVGNSGTLMRLLAGWLASRSGRSWEIDGDSSIRRRPVDRVADPLSLMGASFASAGGRPPFTVAGADLVGIDFTLPVPSAQVKSAILLAGLSADGPTTVRESPRSRDHTELMLAEQGASIEIAIEPTGAGGVTVSPVDRLEPLDRLIPGDPSSAAFPIAAALLVPGSEVSVANVCVNPTRIGFFRILERMGARIDGLPAAADAGAGPRSEQVATLSAVHGPLRGTEVGAEEVPSAIDELPLLALVACFAEGTTTISGAAELRVKETDRIAAVAEGLTGLGADIAATADGLVVTGRGELEGGSIDSRGDHRLAMLGAVAGLASRTGVEVVGFESAAVSYPGFGDDLDALA